MKTNYVKNSLLLSFGIFIYGMISAQNTRYQKSLGGDKDDWSYSIDRTFDGGYVISGYTESYGSGGDDVFVLKTNALGNVIWSKAYGDAGDETGWKIRSTSDSGYIVAGTTNSYDTSRAKGFLMKLDKNGDVIWSLGVGADSADDIYNVIQGRYGDYYATGYSYNDSMQSDILVMRVSVAGKIKWLKKFGSPGNEEGYGIVEDDRGNITVVGMTDYDTITVGGRKSNFGDLDVVVVSVDSSGNLRWMNNYGSTSPEIGWDIKYNAGIYAIAGWTNTFGIDQDMLMMGVDTAGNSTFARGYGNLGIERAFDVEFKPNGGYILTGYNNPSGGTRKVLVLDLLTSGNINRTAILGGIADDGNWPTDAVRAREGGWVVSSITKSFGKNNSSDIYLVRTDETLRSGCNENVDIVNLGSTNFSQYSFGQTTYYYQDFGFAFKVNKTQTADSTLCCRLENRTATKDTLKICEGGSVNIGRDPITGYVYKWTEIGGSFTSNIANPLVTPTKNTTYKLVVSSADGKCSGDSTTISVSVWAYIKADFVRDTAFCEGTNVQVSAYPGMISYTWVGSQFQGNTEKITVSKSDTIYLDLIDKNGCFYKDTLHSLMNPLPRFDLGRDTTICLNLPLTLRGPIGMTNYNWNNGAATTRNLTTVEEKKHNLKVTDNKGCTFSDTIQIFVNPFSTFSLGPDTTFCEGVPYTILGPGAFGGWTWNGVQNNFQNLIITAPGSYRLTAYNSFSCPYSDTVVLTMLSAPKFDLGDSFNLCVGTTKTLKGPAGMTAYKWSTGAITDSLVIMTFGTYYLKITDAKGCPFTDTFKMIQRFPPVIDLGNDTTISCRDSILIDAGAGHIAYVWNNGKTTRTIYAKVAANYTVNVTNIYGCIGSDDKKVDTVCTLGYKNLPFGMQLDLYPNPSDGRFLLGYSGNPQPNWDLAIMDVTGKILREDKVQLYGNSGNMSINLQKEAKGVYWIKISSPTGSVSFKAIVQ
jgi:hypothetical protein